MTLFHDFTASEWKLFFGNLLMLLTCLCYIVWWVLAFKPGGRGSSAVSTTCITAAIVCGLLSIVLLFLGINSYSENAPNKSIIYILAGAVVLYLVLLAVTKIAFHRVVTSELLIMIVWMAVELSVIAVLYPSGRFGLPLTLTLTVLTGIATCIGIICYVRYYRLEGMASFRDGLIPLITDGVAVAVFLAAQMFV